MTYYADDSVTLHHGDCLDVMATLADDSVDAIVTDPPYGLGFMGKDWDDLPPGEPWARECLRVLKPGGHLLAFGGTRTAHRLACAIEDAGFELRDTIAWLYGSGFPKSLDVSKAIDKANGRVGDAILALKARLREAFDASGLTRAEVDRRCGFRAANYLTLPAAGKRPDPWVNVLPTAEKWASIRDALGCGPEMDELFDAAEREVVGLSPFAGRGRVASGSQVDVGRSEDSVITAPATPDAERWQGWGTALKPANEPIIVARKSLTGSVAANVLTYGTGALNIDGCRVEAEPWTRPGGASAGKAGGIMGKTVAREPSESNEAGRWPTNVILDPEAAVQLDAQTGTLVSGANPTRRGSDKFRDAYGDFRGQEECTPARGADSGGASRFFPTFRYEAKAPAEERPRVGQVAHPTVKPLDLMRWLVRLVTPPGGLVLEPFAGSGTTAEACIVEGFRCIAIEREADYLPLILARITKPIEPVLIGMEAS